MNEIKQCLQFVLHLKINKQCSKIQNSQIKLVHSIRPCHEEVLLKNRKPINYDRANHGIVKFQRLLKKGEISFEPFLLSLYINSSRNGQTKPGSWSSIDKEINFHQLESFQLLEKDTIILTFDPLNSIVLWQSKNRTKLCKIKNDKQAMKIKMDLDVHICVGLYKKGDSVEILH